MKTLYKKDSKGKSRKVIIFALGDLITQQSGLVDGVLTTHQSIAKAKNVGRSNETTPQEQAILEVEAKIIKKLKEGYFETIEEAESKIVVLPMLAKVYDKEKHKIDWDNCYVQPKLDGMRCLTFPGNQKISRKNTPIETMNHIVVNFPAELSCPIDGELYVHGESFQKNMKFIKKYRPDSSERIQYWIYDVVSELPFIDRLALVMAVVNESSNCKLVETLKVTNEEQVINVHKKFLADGFEGTIIRWGDESYGINKRSSNLLKHKDFIDESYKVVDVEPSDKNPEQGVIICETCLGGQRFGNGMKFSHEERKEILENKEDYIGQMAEIRFFEFTDDDIPRFPVCVGFRLDC
jgi:DNA ligase-1